MVRLAAGTDRAVGAVGKAGLVRRQLPSSVEIEDVRQRGK